MEETLMSDLIRSLEFQQWAKCMYGIHITKRYLAQCIQDSWNQWLSELEETNPANIETFLQCLRDRNIHTVNILKGNITCKHSTCQVMFERLYSLLHTTDEASKHGTSTKVHSCQISQEQNEEHTSSNKGIKGSRDLSVSCSGFAFEIAFLFVRFEGNEISKTNFDDCSFPELLAMMQNCRLFSFAGSQNVYEEIQRKRQTIVHSRVNEERKTNAHKLFLTLKDLLRNFKKGKEVIELLKKVENVTFEGTEYLRFAKGCLQMKRSALKETYTTGVSEDELILGEIVLLEEHIDKLLTEEDHDYPSEFQQTILCLKEEIRKLKENNTNQQHQIKALLEQLDQLLNQTRKTENELKQNGHGSEQITELKKELEDLTEQNEAHILALEEKEIFIQNEKDKNNKMINKNEKVEAEKCIIELQLEQSKREFEETVSNIECQLKQKESELTEARKEVLELHKELKEQLMQNNDQLKANFSLKKKIDDLNGQKEKLLNQNHEQEDKLKQNKHDLALLQSHKKNLIKVNKTITDENRAHVLALKENKIWIQKERDINTNMIWKIENLESEKCKIELQLQIDKREFEKTLRHFEFQLTERESELIQRRKEVLKLQKDCMESQQTNKQNFSFAARQIDELTVANRQNEILQRRYKVIKDQLKQNERQIVAAKRENKNLIKENQTWTHIKEKFRKQTANYDENEFGRRIYQILTVSQSEFRQINRILNNAHPDVINTVLTTELPDDWSPMSDNEKVKVVVLRPTDPAYKAISTRFMMEVNTGACAGVCARRLNKRMTNIEIRKIERIQNKTLYQQYIAMKKKMAELNPNLPTNMPLEMDLWHGTKYGATTSIALHGFNRSYSGNANGKSWYGDGVYFARDASYSAMTWFSGADTESVGYVFLAKTLTGRFCKGKSGMKYLPAIDPIRDPTDFYDSAVNDPDDPIEFVIFNDTQAYPAYIITFNAELEKRS